MTIYIDSGCFFEKMPRFSTEVLCEMVCQCADHHDLDAAKTAMKKG